MVIHTIPIFIGNFLAQLHGLCAFLGFWAIIGLAHYLVSFIKEHNHSAHKVLEINVLLQIRVGDLCAGQYVGILCFCPLASCFLRAANSWRIERLFQTEKREGDQRISI